MDTIKTQNINDTMSMERAKQLRANGFVTEHELKLYIDTSESEFLPNTAEMINDDFDNPLFNLTYTFYDRQPSLKGLFDKDCNRLVEGYENLYLDDNGILTAVYKDRNYNSVFTGREKHTTPFSIGVWQNGIYFQSVTHEVPKENLKSFLSIMSQKDVVAAFIKNADEIENKFVLSDIYSALLLVLAIKEENGEDVTAKLKDIGEAFTNANAKKKN